MTMERDHLREIGKVQQSSLKALHDDDMTAYKALAIYEARLMNELYAMWATREKNAPEGTP